MARAGSGRAARTVGAPRQWADSPDDGRGGRERAARTVVARRP